MRWALLKIVRPRMQPEQAIRWLTALGMGVAFGMLCLGGAILVDSRADAWHQAEQASNNLVLALARDIARNLRMYDLSIQGAKDALLRPDINQISPETRQMALFDRAASAEYLGALLVLNQDGNIVADSTATEPHQVNLSDRDYFKVQQERADVGLYVSRSFRSRLQRGDPRIAISRRISRPDGTFGGVVVGSMRLAYFTTLFGTLDLGSSGSVTLFRDDGRVIIRLPFRDSDIDRDLGGTPIFGQYLNAEAGTTIGRGTIDDVNRLYSFRHLANLPLILSVAIAVDDIYASWWRKALGIGSVLLLLFGATMVLCRLFRREMLRRIGAERDLREAAGQLTLIATTDSLTGLANRRLFDEHLKQEWHRAIRTETPIALLMLDADFFKRYNDRYGHPAGDHVLGSIAACIAGNVMRPADTPARYGGEEFVALLPETELLGALVVAERIRAAVACLDITHAGNPLGHVSVSIGVAVAHPAFGDAPSTLMAAADAALYDAKHGGRNRVSAAGSIDPPLMRWPPEHALGD